MTGHLRHRSGKAELVVLALAVVAVVLIAVLIFARGGGGSAATTPAGPQGSSADVQSSLDAIDLAKREGAWDKAESLVRGAIEKDVMNQALYVQLAEVLVAKQQMGPAFDAYEKAIAIGPRGPELEFIAATTASDAGKVERAEELYLGVLAERPTDWRHPLYLAQVQVKLGKYAEAKKHLLMTVRLKDDVALAWGMLGELALRENQTAMALQHVAKARALDPKDILWRLVEARALKREGKPEEALNLLVGVSDAELLQPGVVTVMVECYGLLKRPKDAANLYAKLSDMLGDRGDFALEAAKWYTKAGELERAKKYAKHAEYLGVAEAKEVLGTSP